MQKIESWLFSRMSGRLSVNLALPDVSVPCGTVVGSCSSEITWKFQLHWWLYTMPRI